MKTAASRFLPPALALILFLAAWEITVRAASIPIFLLPPPSTIARSFQTDTGLLVSAFFSTAEASLIGFALSAALGIGFGLLLASSRLLERALYPYAVFLQTVPIVAVAPLLVVWFGAGIRAVAVSSLIVSIFPVIANTLSGVRSVEPALRDLFRLYGASRISTLTKLELPAAVPNIVTGLRIASGLAVIGAIVGEFVAGYSEGGAGLGITILSSNRQTRTDLLFAALVLAALLGLGFFGIVGGLASTVLRRWNRQSV